MAEPGSVALENLNLSIDVKKARPESGVAGIVGATERQLRLGRMSESEIGGVFGAVEDVAKFFGAEVGISQQSSEMKAFGKALKEPGANEAIQILFKTELEGKTPEQQAEFLSSGMGSLKEVALKLMNVRSEAPELNGGVIGAELSKLAKEYKSATTEDKKAIDDYLKETKVARKDTFKAMSEMWRTQEDMDTVNRVRYALEKYGNRDSDAPRGEVEDAYKFEMTGGTVRKVASWLNRARKPGTVLRRAVAGLRSAPNRDILEAHANLDILRPKAIAMASKDELVDMWKAGIISTEQLGKVDVDVLLTKKKLNTKQAELIKQGKNRQKSLNAKGQFVVVNAYREHEFYDKFFGTRNAQAENNFRDAQKRYLQFDVHNLQNESAFNAIIGSTGVAIDLALLPRWYKSGASKLAVMGAHGALAITTGVAEGVQFGVDRVEAVIAGDALEKMTAIALSRKMATDKFDGMLKSGEASDKDLLQAAKEVRGGWSVFERESALYASRAADTVSMTEGESLPVSALLAPAEMAEAGIDWATGGVFFGENTAKVATELKQVISQSVDGNGVMSKAEEPDNFEINEQKSLIESSRRNFGIPDEYLTMKGIKTHLSNMFGGEVVERVRQAIGPEAKLPFGLEKKLKGKEAWEVIAGGSRRASIEDVTKKVAPRLAKANKLVMSYANKSGQTANLNSGVEAATAVVLRDALRQHASVELKQIGERSRLDKMGSDVLKISSAGAGLAVAFGITAGIGALTGEWSERTHIKLDTATKALNDFKAIYDANYNSIPEIINPVHEDWATVGANGILGGLQNQEWWANLWANMAGGTDTVFDYAKVTTGVTTALSPILVWGRSMVEIVSRKVKPRTKLFAPTGEVK